MYAESSIFCTVALYQASLKGRGAHLCVLDGKVGEQAHGQVVRVRVHHLLIQQQQLVCFLLLLQCLRTSSSAGRWQPCRVHKETCL